MLPDLLSPDLMNTILVVLEVALAVIGAFIAALWLSLVIWTFRDIRSRSRDVFAQLLATLLVLIFNLPGFVLYMILRPPERLAEAYERALEEEALLQDIEERKLCPGCKRQVEKDFLLCPSCQTRLRKRCLECDRLLHLRWSVCPFCGIAQSPAGAPQEMTVGRPTAAGANVMAPYRRPRRTAPALVVSDADEVAYANAYSHPDEYQEAGIALSLEDDSEYAGQPATLDDSETASRPD